MADGDLNEEDIAKLQKSLGDWLGKTKLIEVEGNSRAIILKTTNQFTPLLRDPPRTLRAGRWTLRTELTSGAVGKLKKRARRGAADGQVP